MSALAIEQAVNVVGYDPLRDSSHKNALAARDQADWLAWIELGGIAPRTYRDYEWATNRLLKMYPQTRFEDFGEAELIHVMRSFPPASRRERVAAMKNWFKWGVRTRRLDRNPFDLLPVVKRSVPKAIEIFTDEEIARLTALPDNNGDLFQILFDAGLRRSEARALRVRNVRLGVQEIQILSSKGGKSRIVPMTTRLHQRIEKWFELDRMQPNEYLWPIRPGGYHLQRNRQMGNTSFQAWYRASIDQAGVLYRNPHTTRHTFATRWLRRGGRLETLSQVMGHASIKTTYDLYAHMDTTDVLRDLMVIEGGK